MSKRVERFTAGSSGVLWGYGQGEWVRHSDYEQLQSTLTEAEQERTIAIRFLVKQGYARCAEPDHGCGGWHWHPKL